MKLCFFPPNTTSVLQPLDQGIIQAFKLRYRKMFLKRLIACMDECQSASELAKKINVYDAVRFVKTAWESVKKKETIEKCFRHSGFSAIEEKDEESDDDTIILGDELDNLEDVELQDLCHTLQIPEFTSEDIDCCHTFGDDWEEELLQNAAALGNSNESEEDVGEEDSDDVDIMPFKESEAIEAIARLRAMFTSQTNVGNYEKTMSHLENIEDEVVHIAMKKKLKSCRQTTLQEYFK